MLAGNWKMNLALDESLAHAEACAQLGAKHASLDIAIFPSAFAVAAIQHKLADAKLIVGAQNCHQAESGAFTGEVSAQQWKSAGITHVLIGHSERREVFGESLDQIADKLVSARKAGLHVIFCVGEKIEERKAGRAEVVVGEQLAAITSLMPEDRSAIDIAYEPVWAIGTGESATPEIAEDMHRHIRRALTALRGCGEARLLYGGSVKPDNAAELAAQENIDGFLVGGASLKIESFAAIAQASAP